MARRNLTRLSDDDLFTSWAEWISRSAGELPDIYWNRFMFSHIRTMFETNPAMLRPGTTDAYTESAHSTLSWLARLYAHDALMFIRREWDTQNNTENLLHLLRELSERPAVLGRKRYRDMWLKDSHIPKDAAVHMADHEFDKFILTRGQTPEQDHISANQANADIAFLEQRLEQALEFANRMLAHRTPPWEPPPFNVPEDLDAALTAITEVFNKYYPLLTGKSMPNPTPFPQFDWSECFRHAWETKAYVAKTRETEEAHARATSKTTFERIKGNIITTTES